MRVELIDIVLDYWIVPETQGLYFIYSKNELIYIGSSNTLHLRLKLKRLLSMFLKLCVTHIVYIEYNEENYRQLENQLIKMFLPIGNLYCVNRKSEDHWSKSSLYGNPHKKRRYSELWASKLNPSFT